MKTVCVLRWGAYGDAIIATVLFPLLKADGYEIHFHCTKRTRDVTKYNPYIDKWILYETDSVPNDELGVYWDNLSQQYDKFINLSGSIEGSLLIPDYYADSALSKKARHERCNINYYDRTLELGGYGHITGRSGELYFSSSEEKLAKKKRHKYRDKFIIAWTLSGSSLHKAYAYTEYVFGSILNNMPEAMIFTLGDALCEFFEVEFQSHPRFKGLAGKQSIRKSLILTKYADLVVGAETGVLNAAACFNTPKIVLLSHSSKENLTKYWTNTTALHALVPCYPCHILHFDSKSCILHPKLETPVCMTNLPMNMVYGAIEREYEKWKEKKNGI